VTLNGLCMLRLLEFDQKVFRRPCYRLRPEISKMEWNQFEQFSRREPVFADLKLPASDLETAHVALQQSFRKICTQVELTHPLEQVELVEGVTFHDHLEITASEQRAHAEHFRTCRFRQDPLIPTEIAVDLYAAWIGNSLSGGKRVAALGRNFCSFVDTNGVRHIDLLSVTEKGRGYGTRLLKSVAYDAKVRKLGRVCVTTEIENEASIKAHRAAAFDIRTFHSVFHFKN
jgi:hypothetical protein